VFHSQKMAWNICMNSVQNVSSWLYIIRPKLLHVVE
jgi:hypothetical protein